MTGKSDEFIYPYVLQWSNSGKYLYYSENFYSNTPDTCLNSHARYGLDMLRLDLETGKTAFILVKDALSWMTLSPSEKMVAYVDSRTSIGTWTEVKWISILGGETKAPIDFEPPSTKTDANLSPWLSYIFWLPDEKSLIYTQVFGPCDHPPLYTSLIRIDLPDQEQTILVDYNRHGYIPVEWNIQNKILLQDNQNTRWWLDPITKEITPAQ